MKRPGDTRQRPPGGGAAGRAQQFDTERKPAADDSKQSDQKEKEVANNSKGTRKRIVKPK
jgi:hypothetical protein